MLELLAMYGNYAARVVRRDDYEWGFISTARVTDGEQPFETAVQHDLYQDEQGNTGGMTIVEAYDSRKDAEAGHTRWVETMTGDTPPDVLEDCCNAGICQVLNAISGRPRETRVTTQ